MENDDKKDDSNVISLDEHFDTESTVTKGDLSDPYTRSQAQKDFVYFGKSMREIAENYGISLTSVAYWKKKEDWDERKKEADTLRVSFHEVLKLTQDPNASIEALKDKSIRKVLNVILLSSHKLEYLLSKEGDELSRLPLAGEVQKLVGALEKFVTAQNKDATKGVDQKSITNVHLHIDVNEAMRLVKEARSRGEKLTVEEAMNIMQASQSVNAKRLN